MRRDLTFVFLIMLATAVSPTESRGKESSCGLDRAVFFALPVEARLRTITDAKDRVIAMAHFADTRNVQISDHGEAQVDGHPTQNLEEGTENLGVYFYTDAHGVKRVLKVYKPNVQSIGEKPGELRRDNFRVLEGHLLAESLGGPKVLSYGNAFLPISTRPLFYVEMTELFPGEEKSSLMAFAKRVAEDRSRAYRDRISNAFFYHGREVGTRGGEMLYRALAARIAPNDADFMFNRQGDLAWVDGSGWTRPRDHYELTDEFSHAATQLFTHFSIIAPQAAGKFLLRFFELLKGDVSLESSVKDRMITEVIHSAKNDVISLKSLADADLIQKGKFRTLGDAIRAIYKSVPAATPVSLSIY